MITKYKVCCFGDKVEKVEVIRETKHSVFLKNRWRQNGEVREAKNSSFARYFDSWKEAHTHLLARAESRVGYLQRDLLVAEKNSRILGP